MTWFHVLGVIGMCFKHLTRSTSEEFQGFSWYFRKISDTFQGTTGGFWGTQRHFKEFQGDSWILRIISGYSKTYQEIRGVWGTRRFWKRVHGWFKRISGDFRKLFAAWGCFCGILGAFYGASEISSGFTGSRFSGILGDLGCVLRGFRDVQRILQKCFRGLHWAKHSAFRESSGYLRGLQCISGAFQRSMETGGFRGILGVWVYASEFRGASENLWKFDGTWDIATLV